MFNRFSRWCADILGRPSAFIASLLLVIVWAIAGPLLNFSTNWQLFINTATTVITFWFVFVIQNTQNHDTKAMHLKLDEIIRALDKADNSLMKIEQVDSAGMAERQTH